MDAPVTTTTTPRAPLEGIRVLDLTRVLGNVYISRVFDDNEMLELLFHFSWTLLYNDAWRYGCRRG